MRPHDKTACEMNSIQGPAAAGDSAIPVRIISEAGWLPAYETQGSAGMDIKAFLNEPVRLVPGQRHLVPTGLYIELPEGFEAQIRARSGLAVRCGVGIVNGVGTIDSDYRGEIKIPLMNWGEEDCTIQNGDRIAQLIVARCERVIWEPAQVLSDTGRGAGGFGHTGV